MLALKSLCMLLIMDSGYDIIVHEDIPGDTNQIIDNTRPQYNSQMKYILYWNKAYGNKK